MECPRSREFQIRVNSRHWRKDIKPRLKNSFLRALRVVRVKRIPLPSKKVSELANQ